MRISSSLENLPYGIRATRITFSKMSPISLLFGVMNDIFKGTKREKSRKKNEPRFEERIVRVG
jgi:hypothetical protein